MFLTGARARVDKRLLWFRLLLVVAATCGMATLFMPFLVVYFMVGFAPQGGVASLWKISPLHSSMTGMLIAALTAIHWIRPPAAARERLLGVATILWLFCLTAVVYMLSPIAEFVVHPLALTTIGTAALALSVASWISRAAAGRRLRFRLTDLFLFIGLAAIFGGFVHAVFVN